MYSLLFNAQTRPIAGSQVLIPLRQETITLLGYPLTAVQLPNKDTAVSLRSLCKMLQVARNQQIRRICDDKILSKHLLRVIIQTSGGPQISDVLTDWAVPIWASGLNISRLTEEKQALARILQQSAFAAIEQAFTQPENDTGALEVPLPLNIIEQIRQKFSLPSGDLPALTTDLQDIKAHVTVLEGRSACSIVSFSPQRLAQINLFAYRVRQRLGYPIATTLAGLAEYFHVPDIFDLSESVWPAVLDWFARLLEEGTC